MREEELAGARAKARRLFWCSQVKSQNYSSLASRGSISEMSTNWVPIYSEYGDVKRSIRYVKRLRSAKWTASDDIACNWIEINLDYGSSMQKHFSTGSLRWPTRRMGKYAEKSSGKVRGPLKFKSEWLLRVQSEIRGGEEGRKHQIWLSISLRIDRLGPAINRLGEFQPDLRSIKFALAAMFRFASRVRREQETFLSGKFIDILWTTFGLLQLGAGDFNKLNFLNKCRWDFPRSCQYLMRSICQHANIPRVPSEKSWNFHAKRNLKFSFFSVLVGQSIFINDPVSSARLTALVGNVEKRGKMIYWRVSHELSFPFSRRFLSLYRVVVHVWLKTYKLRDNLILTGECFA